MVADPAGDASAVGVFEEGLGDFAAGPYAVADFREGGAFGLGEQCAGLFDHLVVDGLQQDHAGAEADDLTAGFEVLEQRRVDVGCGIGSDALFAEPA